MPVGEVTDASFPIGKGSSTFKWRIVSRAAHDHFLAVERADDLLRQRENLFIGDVMPAGRRNLGYAMWGLSLIEIMNEMRAVLARRNFKPAARQFRTHCFWITVQASIGNSVAVPRVVSIAPTQQPSPAFSVRIADAA